MKPSAPMIRYSGRVFVCGVCRKEMTENRWAHEACAEERIRRDRARADRAAAGLPAVDMTPERERAQSSPQERAEAAEKAALLVRGLFKDMPGGGNG